MKKVRGLSAYIPIEEQAQAQLVSLAGPVWLVPSE